MGGGQGPQVPDPPPINHFSNRLNLLHWADADLDLRAIFQ
jgi:hypothetical protein